MVGTLSGCARSRCSEASNTQPESSHFAVVTTIAFKRLCGKERLWIHVVFTTHSHDSKLPDETSGCTPIQWPGERTSARHELEPDPTIQNWFGGLVDGMRDASGQMYKRNRYYDPKTGQFTQPDPIGLAGGLNAYGFADRDPVSYADPYGLSTDSVMVGCRSVKGSGGMGQHCAVRVTNAQIDTTYELLNVGGIIEAGPASADRVAEYGANWVRVTTPEGMSEAEFDAAVLQSARAQTTRQNGHRYFLTGGHNSNRYVFDIVTGAGGLVPFTAARMNGAGIIPGLCGGIGFAMGRWCAGSPPPWNPNLGPE
jgi:RHS repeat-associated protein